MLRRIAAEQTRTRSAPLRERDLLVGGVRVFVRSREGEGTPTLFVHGNPTNSEDWLPFAERLSGPVIAPDLPGFGRSERPARERFGGRMEDHGALLGALLDQLGAARFRLVVHDWGTVGLIAAQASPERLERLVVIDAVPLFASYRWHWIARWFWRRPLAGEAFNALATKPALRLISRQATPRPGPLPEQLIESAWRHWDAGMGEAILRLYRSADPERLGRAGERLGELACPALVLWGERDPYIGVEHARAYAGALPGARLVVLPGAGHWPWLDQPAAIDRVVAFLAAGEDGG